MSRLWYGKKGRRHQPINHKYTLVNLSKLYQFLYILVFLWCNVQNYTISESLSIKNIYRIQNCMITESTFKLFLLILKSSQKEINKGL